MRKKIDGLLSMRTKPDSGGGPMDELYQTVREIM